MVCRVAQDRQARSLRGFGMARCWNTGPWLSRETQQPMRTDEPSSQESGESVDEKRARFERFAMTVCANGVVNVENQSYGDDAGDHVYSVEVNDGEAVGCSCPHAVHRGAHCKHQIAVEQSPIVLSSASAASETPEVATDGGRECDHITDDPEDCLICELQEKYGVGETITDDEGEERPARSESPDMGGGEHSGVDEL